MRRGVIEFIRKNQYITRKEVEELLNCGTTKAFTVLKTLRDEGELVAEGSGKPSRYRLP